MHEQQQLRRRTSDDLRPSTPEQTGRTPSGCRRDGVHWSAAGNANDGSRCARGGFGVGAHDEQLDVTRCIVDPIENRREDMRHRCPIVRHLIDNVLPPRDGGLFCFLIHFSLDCAQATKHATWHTVLPVPRICRADKYSGLRKANQIILRFRNDRALDLFRLRYQ